MKMMRIKEKEVAANAIAKMKESATKTIPKEGDPGSIDIPNVQGLLIL